jgi:hypothetical protein
MMTGWLPVVRPGVVQAIKCVGAEGAVELGLDRRVLSGEDHGRGVALAAQEFELCGPLVG